MWGRSRPHNGFVFGGALSVAGYLISLPFSASPSLSDASIASALTGSTVAFWIWLYDIHAVRSGFLVIYNRPFRDNLGPEAIVTEFAPAIFFTFGAIYGVAIQAAQHFSWEGGFNASYWAALIGFNLLAMTATGATFVLISLFKYGDMGLSPITSGMVEEEK